MNSLTQLFAAAQAVVEAKEKAKETKKAVAKAIDPAAALQALRLQAESEWRPYAIVLRVDQWVCACGCTGEAPLGFFLLQTHIRLADSYRFLPQRAESTEDLPHRLRVEQRSVLTCHHCMALRGFTPLPARIAPPVIGAYVRDWLAKTAPLQGE